MKIIIKKLSFIILVAFLTATLASCWSNVDIKNRSFVSAIGLDKTKDNKIEVTLQIVKPSAINTENSGASTENAIWTFSTTGETIYEAVRNQLKTVNRKPLFSHIALIVIGEDLAKDGIDILVDLFERDRETRLTPSVLIAKASTAKLILSCASELEDIPAMHIKEILENNKYIADTLDLTLFDLINRLDFNGNNLAIGAIQLRQEVLKNESNKINEIKDKKVEGVGVFKDGKLIGWLNSIETRGFLFAINKVQNTIININSLKSENKKIAIEVVRSSGKLHVDLIDGEIKLSVDVKAEGNIGENQGRDIIASKKDMKIMENMVANEIHNEIENTLHIAQEKFKNDFFGFDKKLYQKYPKLWRDIEKEWNDIFSKLDIEVSTRFYIKRTGLIYNR